MKLNWILPCVLLFAANICIADMLKSPDGQITLSVELIVVGEAKGCPAYSVSFKGKPILAESQLGFDQSDGSSLLLA